MEAGDHAHTTKKHKESMGFWSGEGASCMRGAARDRRERVRVRSVEVREGGAEWERTTRAHGATSSAPLLASTHTPPAVQSSPRIVDGPPCLHQPVREAAYSV